MKLTELEAISPIDGRYRKTTEKLSNYFSESALIKYRVWVEVEYFIALCETLPQLKSVTKKNHEALRKIYLDFSIKDAIRIKEIEKTTNHDVKAVEYFLKEKFEQHQLGQYKEFIHFALTSQDINNTAIPASLRDCMLHVFIPLIEDVIKTLNVQAKNWIELPMLSRTHGQPASPTRLGKEIKVYVERLENQLKQLKKINLSAKFGGATGNFNAHHAAYPKTNWIKFANDFVTKKLHLRRSQYTTQIDHYDSIAELCDLMKRINTILVDLDRDMWQYISMDYFKQKIKKNEVGSSAMPHKVNPIDFENSEGNLGIANALFEHLAAKLPVSRLQRDLTDSTVLRTIGVPFAHSLIAYTSLLKGLDKLILNESALLQELDQHWIIIAEGIQTILRREGYPNPYEALKELTRTNSLIDKNEIHHFIDHLKVSDNIKKELKQLSPAKYIGIIPD